MHVDLWHVHLIFTTYSLLIYARARQNAAFAALLSMLSGL